MYKRFFSLALSVSLLAACQSDPATNTSSTLDPNQPVIDSATGQAIRLPNKWKGEAACDLLTDQEFYGLFKVEEKRDVANRRTLPNANYCLRTWKKPDWREREVLETKNPKIATNPESMLAIEVLDFGTPIVAQTQFESIQTNAVKGYRTPVPNLGEGALWSTENSMLLFKKGHLCIQIKLDHADSVDENLPLAVEIAKLALQKM